jgi:hypothetical protein
MSLGQRRPREEARILTKQLILEDLLGNRRRQEALVHLVVELHVLVLVARYFGEFVHYAGRGIVVGRSSDRLTQDPGRVSGGCDEVFACSEGGC